MAHNCDNIRSNCREIFFTWYDSTVLVRLTKMIGIVIKILDLTAVTFAIRSLEKFR